MIMARPCCTSSRTNNPLTHHNEITMFDIHSQNVIDFSQNSTHHLQRTHPAYHNQLFCPDTVHKDQATFPEDKTNNPAQGRVVCKGLTMTYFHMGTRQGISLP